MLHLTLALLLSSTFCSTSPHRVHTGQESKSAAPSLETIQKSISEFRIKAYAESKASKSPLQRSELEAKVSTFARAALTGIDIKTLDGRDASEWAQLFTMAGMTTEAKTLQENALMYHNVQLMFTEVDLLRTLIRSGKESEALFLLKHAPDYDASMLGMIGESFTNACREAKLDKSKPAFVEQGYKTLMSKVDLTSLPPGRKTSMADYVYVDLDMKSLEMKYANQPSPKILAEMKALRTRFASSTSTNAFGQHPAYRIDEFTQKVAAMGTPAPEVVYQNTIGDFHGLKSLKGKVVLLDFMAHWCGPCKAALPSIKKMQDQFGSAGLQVVSVTSFYGYYGAKQGVAQADEFAQMHDFVKQYQMARPVLFDGTQEPHARYHVGAIPHMVVIDRKGNVRKIEVGHTVEGEAELAVLVKKLLDEKAV